MPESNRKVRRERVYLECDELEVQASLELGREGRDRLPSLRGEFTPCLLWAYSAPEALC